MKSIKFICKIAIGIFLAMLTFSGCDSWRAKVVQIDQESKDYCLFGEGSYWVYQDSVTNNTDSVLLLQSLLECKEEGGEWGHNFIIEYYYANYCHYLSDTSISVSYRLDPSRVYFFLVIVFSSEVQNIEKNTILIPYERFTDYYLSSYNIGENIFNNVKIFIEKNIIIGGYLSNYSIKSYWAKHIGLIRYEIYNSDNEILNTYNLIRYNVKPYKP